MQLRRSSARSRRLKLRLHEQRKFQQSEFELRNTLASLKSEEEKTEMKLSREKLGAIRREFEDLRRKYG